MRHFTDEDRALASMLMHNDFLDGVDPEDLPPYPGMRTHTVALPDAEYSFLHEAAVIEYGGVLFAAWYNNTEKELHGYTPIRFSRSRNGGQSWDEPRILAHDPTGKILYCPPVFGIDDGKLYVLLNEMVGPDLIHALDLYVWDGESETFVFLWSRPIPFKLNTNVIRLPDGRQMLPGRICELDHFPATPAVLLSDSGKIDGDWRIVPIQADKYLPDGAELVHPELTAILDGDAIRMFSRNDRRRVPLVWQGSADGECWSGVQTHDIPFSATKIYGGTLSDGRHYLIGNLYTGRAKLAIFLSEPGEMRFTKGYVLQNGPSEAYPAVQRWHYPAAAEGDGVLYVICTMEEEKNRRGAVLMTLPLQ